MSYERRSSWPLLSLLLLLSVDRLGGEAALPLELPRSLSRSEDLLLLPPPPYSFLSMLLRWSYSLCRSEEERSLPMLALPLEAPWDTAGCTVMDVAVVAAAPAVAAAA